MNQTSTTKLVTFLAILTTSAAFGQNLLTNPSFELGSFVDRGDGAEILGAGSTTMTGWTVVTDEIAWVMNGNAFGLVADNGTHFLDLTGDNDSVPHGGVTQAISTTPGQIYRMTLSLGIYNDDPRTVGPVSVVATAGSASMPFTFDSAGSGNQWGTFSFDFTADSASTPITIQGISTAGGIYIGVDNAGVAVVPEPSSALLLLSGAALCFRRRSLRTHERNA